MNKTIRKITMYLGLLYAFLAFEHGLFAFLQGNKSIIGYIIQTIGSEYQQWEHGNQEAFTLIPNYFYSGLAAIVLSFFAAIWSLRNLEAKYGSLIFIILFMLLTLVGGGISFIPFFLFTWAYSTRINGSLKWWKDFMPDKFSKGIVKLWPYLLSVVFICWALAIMITIFGYYPGKALEEELLTKKFSLLFTAFIFIHLTYISGIAADIEAKES
jgi:hypothetical protein